ncbi:helix-turn-helix domain-containing protein [Citrobacter amalonaticus]|uniref:helix-turn-helix domain-containing protein n=1 Tax=Citrobacter amalonaticus TaxID=35703 RepID=UPI001A2B38B8|nr:AraC family transcriptional regulator [Citrobacter amalonaticus]MCP1629941.1 AraC-like DNA-binding protein [Citrobacter amalonaticus]HAU5634547.1 helix-turn-helix transcriptional regulator [Citrobacter amalonaticus]HDQ2810001.1 helix-turn-helix transcriptional regulator [Citrobacter amalonaticus]HDZ8012783.1 helix-turn-helix transcriptional regulator [Citrobacter amalonaticus]
MYVTERSKTDGKQTAFGVHDNECDEYFGCAGNGQQAWERLHMNSTCPPPITSSASGLILNLSSAIQHVVLRLENIKAEPSSLQELAIEVGLSRYQLIRLFFKEVGMTPHAYKVFVKIHAARQLLQLGSDLTTAAIESGFSDQSHMSRIFRRQFGVTPGQYRKMLV